MKIVLDNIMPTPLASIQHGANSIWGNYIELLPGKKIMLNASSGKGKSTFTLTTIGLRRDYSGTVSYDGVDIRVNTPEDWTLIRQHSVSVVFQDLQLFHTLTVKENLELKNNISQTFSQDELRHMLDELGIADKWEQTAGLLSMGQQQRVAIIRALSQPFHWLMMDEPFSHLDEENTQKCLAMIDKRCNAINAGFVLTTLGDSHNFAFDQELTL